jgi:phenylalanine ammonia-lyase
MLSMPEAWVRGMMVIRCNYIARGHSGVRHSIMESIVELLNRDLIPLIPLRGSISASGDLSPLSYIAGVLEANPDILVWAGDRKAGRGLITSPEALSLSNIEPITFGPKEGLGLLNGTAASSAIGALALHEADHLAVLSQLLTAMSVEALSGSSESFSPFLSAIRPHEGQIEAADNIRRFLAGSKLAYHKLSARGGTAKDHVGLRQDRYSIRTSPQWIGPNLEDLLLARKQISVELNSTTDNPVIDVATEKIFHGGNFQAMAITTAMEKVRLVLQRLGKMLFAQCSELINPALNNGLPPNLIADEPSLSYTMKGVDINMAAYTAELGFLANPVGSHVQSAEMANQAINSMAFVSARYTHAAIDVMPLLASSYLYVLCQALDLRVMQLRLLNGLKPILEDITGNIFGQNLSQTSLDELNARLWEHVLQSMTATTTMDSSERWAHIMASAQSVIVTFIATQESTITEKDICSLTFLRDWVNQATARSLQTFLANRESAFRQLHTAEFLGDASRRLYNFVRLDLEVPFHKGLIDHPRRIAPAERLKASNSKGDKANIGSRISVIYQSLRSGKLSEVLMACLADSAKSEMKL